MTFMTFAISIIAVIISVASWRYARFSFMLSLFNERFRIFWEFRKLIEQYLTTERSDVHTVIDISQQLSKLSDEAYYLFNIEISKGIKRISNCLGEEYSKTKKLDFNLEKNKIINEFRPYLDNPSLKRPLPHSTLSNFFEKIFCLFYR